jgi:hypothetical protein
MTRPVDLVSEIVIELKRVQGLAESPIDKDDVLPIPRMTSTGNGNGLIKLHRGGMGFDGQEGVRSGASSNRVGG